MAYYNPNPGRHYPSQAQHVIAPPRNGLGIASLCCALTGLVLGLVPLTGWLAIIVGAIAVILGACALGRVRRGEATNRKMSWAGLILGLGAVALGIAGMVIVGNALDQLDQDLNGTDSPPASTSESYGATTPLESSQAVQATSPPPPVGPVSSFGDVQGWVIGEDIAPGTYRNTGGGKLCYWSQENADGDYLDSGFGDGEKRVKLRSVGSVFTSSSCGQWTATD